VIKRRVRIEQVELARCDQCNLAGRCKVFSIHHTPLLTLCAVCWEELLANHRDAFSP
jgi:hypothetical protein